MFRKVLNKISRENLIIIYKLLADLLFIFLIFFFFMLIGESLLPGIISTRISFSIVIIAILLDILLIRKLAVYLNIQKSVEANPAPSCRELSNQTKLPFALKFFGRCWASKKALLIGAFVFAIFILNSLVNLFRFNILLAVLVFLLVLATGYFIYKMTFED